MGGGGRGTREAPTEALIIIIIYLNLCLVFFMEKKENTKQPTITKKKNFFFYLFVRACVRVRVWCIRIIEAIKLLPTTTTRQF